MEEEEVLQPGARGEAAVPVSKGASAPEISVQKVRGNRVKRRGPFPQPGQRDSLGAFGHLGLLHVTAASVWAHQITAQSSLGPSPELTYIPQPQCLLPSLPPLLSLPVSLFPTHSPFSRSVSP